MYRSRWGGARGSCLFYVSHLFVRGRCRRGYVSVVLLELWFVFVQLWVCNSWFKKFDLCLRSMFYRRSGVAEFLPWVSYWEPLCVVARSHVVFFVHVVGVM